MGQKSSPLALRSQILRSSTSLWFEESSNYGKLFSDDFSLYTYLQESLANLGIEAHHHLLFRQPKRTLFYSIAYNGKGKYVYKKKRKTKKKKYFFLEKYKKEKKALFFFSSFLSNTEKTTYINLKNFSFFISQFSKHIQSERTRKIQYAFNNLHMNLIQFKRIRKRRKDYISCLKNSIEKYSNFPFTLHFSRKRKVKQKPYVLSAKHIVQRISACLRMKKNPSYAIKKLFRILQKKSKQNISGLRCNLSGRFTARAKMAKKLNFTSGNLALSSLSQSIDFAKTTVTNPKGSIGVKVWLSFRPRKTKSSKNA